MSWTSNETSIFFEERVLAAESSTTTGAGLPATGADPGACPGQASKEDGEPVFADRTGISDRAAAGSACDQRHRWQIYRSGNCRPLQAIATRRADANPSADRDIGAWEESAR